MRKIVNPFKKIKRKIYEKRFLEDYKDIQRQHEKLMDDLQYMHQLCCNAGHPLNDLRIQIEEAQAKGEICRKRFQNVVNSLDNKDYKYLMNQLKIAADQSEELSELGAKIDETIKAKKAKYGNKP